MGNGDPSLTMYGDSITPNLHKLALQFGVLDNFFDSGEVSGDGHVWSTAAIGTDYLEKTWQQIVSRLASAPTTTKASSPKAIRCCRKFPTSTSRTADISGATLPLTAKRTTTLGNTSPPPSATEARTANPQLGPMLAGRSCEHKAIAPGEACPPSGVAASTSGPGPFRSSPPTLPPSRSWWATSPPSIPDFNLLIPDQVRFEVFEPHLKSWIADREDGNDTMPNFVMLRFPNDHTAGTRPGGPTPKSSVADNDLAVGRAVEAISHSPFWDDTAFFILEDDAQAGADHVDAHRSIGLVISKYSPHGPDGAPFVDSRFYSTVSVLRTMESLLGLPPMNNNDAFCSLISTSVYRPRRSACLHGGLFQSRQRPYLYRQ